MFARIAGWYYRMNRLMKPGQDLRWCLYVIEQARLPENDCLLNIATNENDIAMEGLRKILDL